MKKANLVDLISILKGEEVTEKRRAEILDDLEKEQAKGTVKTEATRKEYADLHDLVFQVLRDNAGKALSADDLANETHASRNKISWGMKNLWGAEVIVDDTGAHKTYQAIE